MGKGDDMVRIIRAILTAVRFALPWVLRAFLFTLRLMANSFVNLWIGVPNVSKNIADSWLDKAVMEGYPTRYDRQLYYVLCTVAFLTIVAGWIFLAYSTFWIFHRLF